MKSMMACLIVLLSSLSAFAGPRVDIVIGEKAPALERFAADELAGQLKRVYEAEVKIGSTAPADAPHVIFVGSPDTNARMKPFADSWPSGDKKLTDQGHLLRSVTHNNKPALLIGGGSPVATFWAVAEFGHHLGIRPLLFGDLDPISPPEFMLDEIDVVLEPQHREREWHFRNREPMDSGSWSVEEHRRVLQQLAKLKFNRVSINVRASQPFVHFEFQGVPRKTDGLWGFQDRAYLVSGDTSGRKVFGGAKLFENPSFAGATSYEDRIAAGKKHLTGIVDAAHAVGMTVRLQLRPDWFPEDFGAFVKEPKGMQGRDGPHVVSDESAFFRDDKTLKLARAQLRAYLDAYPAVDGIDLEFNAAKVSEKQFRRVFPDQDFWRRTDGRVVDVRVRANEYPARTFTALDQLGQPLDFQVAQPMLLLTEADDFVPSSPADFPEKFEASRQRSSNNYLVDPEGISDLDLPIYWLSRHSFGAKLTFEQTCREVLDPTCGEGVADRVLTAFQRNHQARQLMQRLSFGGGMSGPVDLRDIDGAVSRHPMNLTSATDDYLNAMNEMYRANTRAREGGRAFTLYWARRFEFALEYLSFAQAVQKASAAETAKDTTTQIAELEKGIESLNNGLNALAAVARSNSDRGMIAVLNKYGYRPLKKKLAEAEAAK
ncbi:MAG: hypothetical protein ACKV2Q_15960 [Planctomycetaceae bacterium]